jgi:hypothetical protein
MKSNMSNPDLSKLLKHRIVFQWFLAAGFIVSIFVSWYSHANHNSASTIIIFLFLFALNAHDINLYKKLIELFGKNST